jgi:hypothetical protein
VSKAEHTYRRLRDRADGGRVDHAFPVARGSAT